MQYESIYGQLDKTASHDSSTKEKEDGDINIRSFLEQVLLHKPASALVISFILYKLINE
jgi:hypothetical protein